MGLGKLLIVGTGGHGKVVLDCALSIGRYSDISFMTNDKASNGIAGFPAFLEQDICCSDESQSTFFKDFEEVVVAIGNNDIRLEKSLHFLNAGMKLATLVHPRAFVSSFANIGAGTVVFANAVVNAYANIGMACIINTGAIVEHDCALGNGVHISPNACLSGSVTVCEKSWVCTGSSIANNIKIGYGSVIGAGAAVIHDIPDRVLAAGVPATIRKRYE